jgi:hypothetical protein
LGYTGDDFYQIGAGKTDRFSSDIENQTPPNQVGLIINQE